jgi:hypothetical protein
MILFRSLAATAGQRTPSHTAKDKTMSKTDHKSASHQPAPQRGALLTIAIILVILHGAAFTALSYSVIKGVMWFWKRWGVYLYVIAGLTTAVLFLMRTGSIWMFFGALLPMVIVGYILQPRLKYFTQ